MTPTHQQLKTHTSKRNKKIKPFHNSSFSRKVISSNNAVCTMQITDTAGSHQFPAMQRLSISKGNI